ncbi:(2Fe-2S)-binding protein [Variovorax sp. N23]|uniref:(2Fe-2S)-binding protein n=1 Tax=Variovorax sp. N23 TaxID=2980555 RepID=UPI0021C76F6C|nr:2Fe-2S iron-sulfur cluster-binding protein [Variovorax sp. N23]MCU4119024.1 2Fe-2S iron-sulfur cluster-binding protein [Variovorax sp. N23]
MKAEVAFNVNGRPAVSEVDTRTTLLDLLREQLGLTGAKKGCDHGQCGACTVLVDGRRSLSCLRLAVTLEGRSVTTVEGLGTAEALHPVQAAFVRHDALQCGFCTPGQIMSAVEVAADPCATSRCAIRELMSGNLCRCGAYPHIVAAIEEVRGHGSV